LSLPGQAHEYYRPTLGDMEGSDDGTSLEIRRIKIGAMIKMQLLAVLVIGSLLTSRTWGDDLPKMGYMRAIPGTELVAKGYRWVTLDGITDCDESADSTTGNKNRLTKLETSSRPVKLAETSEARSKDASQF
jgi:hypothetical protein